MNFVTIERNADDGLSGTWWRFFFHDVRSIPPVIYLDECHEWTRPTRRHRKTVIPKRNYNRFDNGQWYQAVKHGYRWLPPLPDDVVAEAREKFCQQSVVDFPFINARIVAPTQADIDRIRETGR